VFEEWMPRRARQPFRAALYVQYKYGRSASFEVSSDSGRLICSPLNAHSNSSHENAMPPTTAPDQHPPLRLPGDDVLFIAVRTLLATHGFTAAGVKAQS